MCVILYKPENINFPNKTILKTCFENNQDGAGIMYAVNNAVHISKGFMTFNAFYKALKEIRKAYGDNIPYVLHFRISTQGGTRADCTHPFPLSSDMGKLRKLKTKCKIGIAHNGIISLTSTGYSRAITYNDTMQFITNYLSLIIKHKTYYKDKDTVTLIDRLVDSRLAILDDAGHCEIIGRGWIEDNGVFYSNSSYKPYKPVSRFSYNYDDYIDYYNAYDRLIDSKWDEYAGVYKFNQSKCPLIIDNDDSFCECCEHYAECYGLIEDGQQDDNI